MSVSQEPAMAVPPIEATVFVGDVYFKQAVPEILRAFNLSTSEVVARDGQFRIESKGLPEYTWKSLLGKSMMIPLGYWPRSQRILDDAGYQYTVIDGRRECDHFVTANLNDLVFYGDSRAFLSAIRDRPRGLWVVAPQDRDRRIADFCRFFPDAKITVVDSHQRRARRLRCWLAHELGEKVGLEFQSGVSSDHQDKLPRIYVRSPAGLYSRFLFQHQIAILADAENATGSHYFTACKSLSPYLPHLIGLIPPKWSPTSLARDRKLEWLCGEPLQPNTAPTAPIVLVMKSGGANAPDCDDPRDRRRVLYTRHGSRNAKIARIAQAIADGDLDELCRKVPRDLHPYLERAIRTRAIAVLCENSEQVADLKVHLRGWTVLRHGSEFDPDAARRGSCICTPVFASESGIDPPVIIRASGGGGPLHVKWLSDDPDRFVIDFDDRFHQRAISDTRKRIAGYDADGWSVFGVTVAPAARPPSTG